MGLRAHIDLHEWGFPDSTPELHLPIKYDGVGELFAQTAEELAKGTCPVDTGYLQSSISGNGNDTSGTIEARAEYAQYVEYGTKKMGAQSYFTPAVMEAAQTAFMMAAQIYQQMLELEQMLLEQMAAMSAMMSMGMGSLSNMDGPGGGGQTMAGYALTETVGGVSFKKDGSLTAGMNYLLTRPDMWREGTTFHAVAQTRSANLESYRSIAMDRWASRGSSGSFSSAMASMTRSFSSGSGSAAVNFGTSVGMSVMNSIMSNGGSFLGGLAGGMAIGGLATLAGLFLGDIFGGGGPQFTMPEIEIT